MGRPVLLTKIQTLKLSKERKTQTDNLNLDAGEREKKNIHKQRTKKQKHYMQAYFHI